METIKGLSGAEVLESLKIFGPNTLTIKKRPSFWQKYWGKFDDPIITILLVALGVNVIFTFFGKLKLVFKLRCLLFCGIFLLLKL